MRSFKSLKVADLSDADSWQSHLKMVEECMYISPTADATSQSPTPRVSGWSDRSSAPLFLSKYHRNSDWMEESYVNLDAVYDVPWEDLRCFGRDRRGDGFRFRLSEPSFARVRIRLQSKGLKPQGGWRDEWVPEERLWEDFSQRWITKERSGGKMQVGGSRKETRKEIMKEEKKKKMMVARDMVIKERMKEWTKRMKEWTKRMKEWTKRMKEWTKRMKEWTKRMNGKIEETNIEGMKMRLKERTPLTLASLRIGQSAVAKVGTPKSRTCVTLAAPPALESPAPPESGTAESSVREWDIVPPFWKTFAIAIPGAPD
jgi:hypothetical protein